MQNEDLEMENAALMLNYLKHKTTEQISARKSTNSSYHGDAEIQSSCSLPNPLSHLTQKINRMGSTVHNLYMQHCSSSPPVVIGICDS